jgi:two-component system, NarL family, sensor histidine kinase DesK
MSERANKLDDGPNVGGQRASGYIWLAYSVFFFVEPVMRRDRRFWVECLAIYAVFLLIYVGLYMPARSLRQRHLMLAGFYVLGLVTIPINPGSSTIFVYSTAFLPFLVPSMTVFISLVVVMCAGVFVEGMLLHLNLINTGATIFFMSVVGIGNGFIAQAKRNNYKLGLAHEEIEQLAALAERERIARDLHDVLGHTLSVIVLKAELAGRLIDRDPARAGEEIRDVERTARTALDDVRQAIGGYRSKGLAAELELARNTLQSAGVALECGSAVPKLKAAEETVMCLAVREAVTNIVRHAHAAKCIVRFDTTQDGYLSMRVEDDGTHALTQEGNGLRGMRERVEAIGGRFSIRSEGGTKLLIELPGTRPIETGSPECVAL